MIVNNIIKEECQSLGITVAVVVGQFGDSLFLSFNIEQDATLWMLTSKINDNKLLNVLRVSSLIIEINQYYNKKATYTPEVFNMLMAKKEDKGWSDENYVHNSHLNVR